MNTNNIILPDGWEVDKIKGNKIFLKETRKNKLPKTWEECIRQIGKCEYITATGVPTIMEDLSNFTCFDWYHNTIPLGYGKPMIALCKLLVCREIYRKGWKPNVKEEKYCIHYANGELSAESNFSVQKVLSFQTAEIRDEFFNNFHDLIEEAKELI